MYVLYTVQTSGAFFRLTHDNFLRLRQWKIEFFAFINGQTSFDNELPGHISVKTIEDDNKNCTRRREDAIFSINRYNMYQQVVLYDYSFSRKKMAIIFISI